MMNASEPRQAKLQRLAKRIAGGEVVFFIGAGFSVDSEKNTTKTLIARLLARLEALTDELKKQTASPQAQRVASDLSRGIRITFGLDRSVASLFDPGALAKNLTTLARNYYLINDWACSAFEQLLNTLREHGTPDGLAQAVRIEENHLLEVFWSFDSLSNRAPAQPIDFQWYFELRKEWDRSPNGHRDLSLWGKVLFLETLGFNCQQVMGGQPLEPVSTTGETLLRPRHHVLARLAAEGLCPALVTTNYDQLLECAYRDSGMLPAQVTPSGPKPKTPLNRRYRFFNRIAEATQFFSREDARGTALIHKIHGCAGVYRTRRAGDAMIFRDFLSSIVFTFREIQNWREDSWSRDYLSTLLRTRTIVFSGYSGADPVLHDTIRTVYEEMAGYHAKRSAPLAPELPPQQNSDARAFFFDFDSKRDFYGMEILRAASAAVGGVSRELTDHPNLITFHWSDQAEFPHLDETYTWLYHLCYRELERQALETELRRVAYQLFDRPCAEEEALRLIAAFDRLCTAEQQEASLFDGQQNPADSRRKFDRMISWTHGFHLKLMREFALAEALLREPGDRSGILFMKNRPWYRPVSEHQQWAAWGVVIELAMRRSLCAYQQSPDAWTANDPYLEPMDIDPPTILFAASPKAARQSAVSQRRAFVRRAIVVECPAARGHLEPAVRPRHFSALSPRIWQVGPGAVPWWSTEDKRRPENTPDARQLWNWACGSTAGSEKFFEEDGHVN